MRVRYIIFALAPLQVVTAVINGGPTHIIRLAHGANGSLVSGDKIILQKYRQYQTMAKPGPNVAGELDSGLLNDPANLTNIVLGSKFNVVTGTFHPSFIEHIQYHKDIQYVEKNEIYRATQLRPLNPKRLRRSIAIQKNPPNWGLARLSRQKTGDADAYIYESVAGDGVQVFILDTGINVAHKDFEGRASMDANFVDEEPEDDLGGHGTHVAGIIGGSSFGVSKKARLRSVKILDKYGDGTTVSLLKALEHIGKRSKGEKSVINLSLSGPKSKLVNDALSSTSNDFNIPIFVSAGNTADDACNYSPSDNPDAFTVGSIDREDKVSRFSATGDCVRLYAPGQDIKSTWIGSNEDTMVMDGTSMANPHVSGIAALLMSRNSYSSPHELYNAITDLAMKGEMELQSENWKSSHVLVAHV